MTTTHEEEVRIPLSEAAYAAWGAQAQFDLSAALNSFQTQLFRRIKHRRDDYEVETMMFPDEYDPVLQIGCTIDGLQFCLDRNRQVSVVAWLCAQKGCTTIKRAPFTDLKTLGRALTHGAQLADRHPKCDRHS